MRFLPKGEWSPNVLLSLLQKTNLLYFVKELIFLVRVLYHQSPVQKKIDLQPLCRPPQLWLYSFINAAPTFPNWCLVRIFTPSNETCPWMNPNAHQSLPDLSFCCHLHTLCKEHHKPTSNNKNSLWAQCHSCSPNSTFCPCLPPFSYWRCDIPNHGWLPSFLQSSVWSCFSVTLGKPRSETLHSFHFPPFQVNEQEAVWLCLSEQWFLHLRNCSNY